VHRARLAALHDAGDWLFLDGGELSLGVVRDIDLVSRNDFRLFSETFENVAHVGAESLKVVVDVCASGATPSPSDIAVCVSNS